MKTIAYLPIPSVDQADAAVQLALAAPDLLAALREIVARWDSLTIEPVPDQINANDLWDNARAAIAKAEGKQ